MQFLFLSALSAQGAPEPVSDDPADGAVVGDPSPAQVATKASLFWTYEVGSGGLSAGAELWIEDPSFHGQRWSKWGDVSVYQEDCTSADDEAMSWGLVTVSTTGAADLRVERTNCGNGPGTCSAGLHTEAATIVRIESGTLSPGERIVVVHGDASVHANCGFQTPTRAFSHVDWSAWERSAEQDGWRSLRAAVLSFEPEVADKLSAFLPSTSTVGETVTLKVVTLDRWGNAAPLDGDLKVGGHWTEQNTGLGWTDLSGVVEEPGVFRLPVQHSSGLMAETNPMEVSTTIPSTTIHWGDLHVHHGYGWTGRRRGGTQPQPRIREGCRSTISGG